MRISWVDQITNLEVRMKVENPQRLELPIKCGHMIRHNEMQKQVLEGKENTRERGENILVR